MKKLSLLYMFILISGVMHAAQPHYPFLMPTHQDNNEGEVKRTREQDEQRALERSMILPGVINQQQPMPEITIELNDRNKHATTSATDFN